MPMTEGLSLAPRIIKRINMTFSIVIVNALISWTHENMSVVQGMCLIALLFITAVQLSKKMAQPRLIRLICLLYCNQQIRKLFISESDSVDSLFPNVLLAMALAVTLITLSEKDNASSLEDLRTMLEGLMYMYGDILDFLFEYGIIPVTAAAFGISLMLDQLETPKDPMKAFIRRLIGIVSTNIIYQGITSLITSTDQIELVESIASTSILRLLLPSMESYLTYLTAARMTSLIPGIAPAIACALIWMDFLPSSSRGWVSELFTVYIMQAVVGYIITVPTWGAIVVLILAHYTDYIIVHLNESNP
jgi:hypothetical protein